MNLSSNGHSNNCSNNKKLLANQSIRVLIVDDARVSQHIIQQHLLDAGYKHIQCVNSPKEVREHIAHFAPQIIILDWMMPEINGLSLTKTIRAQDKVKNTHTYVLMITGKESQKAMMQAFQEGVDDFIGKADVASQLIPRMLRAQRTLTEWHERQALIGVLRNHLQEQKQLITIDPISQLPTLLGFKDQFSKSIETASARNQGMSCMLIHISNYEKLRNSVQPLAMQRIIRMFVEKVAKYVRPSDYLARTSAHEFTVIFLHDKGAEISTLDRIERGLNQVSLKTKEGFHTLEVRTANTSIVVDTFAEHWDNLELRHFLRQTALEKIPLVNRLHQEWPQNTEKRNRSMEDFIFTDIE